MKTLQETFEACLLEIVAEEDSVGSLDDLKATIAETIPDIAESTAESMLARIKDDAAVGLKEKWDYQQQFEERLRKHWGKPLELLDLFISLATEAGDEFHKTFRDEAARSNDAVFKALTLLHSRACQVASATLVLLRSGYADDARGSVNEVATPTISEGREFRRIAIASGHYLQEVVALGDSWPSSYQVFVSSETTLPAKLTGPMVEVSVFEGYVQLDGHRLGPSEMLA